MKLHFTLAEKMNFLQSRGYTLHEQTIEVEEHIHGSRFRTHTRVVYIATKPGEKEAELKQAFEIELKKKLLTE